MMKRRSLLLTGSMVGLLGWIGCGGGSPTAPEVVDPGPTPTPASQAQVTPRPRPTVPPCINFQRGDLQTKNKPCVND